MRYWIAVLTVCVVAGCGSDKEPAQDTPAPAPATQSGEMQVAGNSVQISWIRELTESFKATELAYDLGDTNGAIWTAESLLVVSEAAMDTLPPNDQMTRFILVFTSDVYASLRRWYTVGGRVDEARELSERYIDLAERMQEKRNAATGQTP